MAEEQIMSSALVLSASIDKVAARLGDIRHSYLRKKFSLYFMQLCSKYYNLNCRDLLVMSNDEILALEQEVFKRANSDFKIAKYFGLPLIALIPFSGWGIAWSMWSRNYNFCDCCFISYGYCEIRRELMEINDHEREFFPFDTLKSKTEEAQ